MSDTDFNVDAENLKVTIKKEFKAPRERVWEAMVNPEMVAKWWGPRALKMTVETYEATPGGHWRILHAESDGKQHWFNGEFKVVDKPTKIVRTFIYEPYPDNIMTETSTLEETQDGNTLLTTVSQFPSKEALSGMVSTGMEYGSRESMDRLSELLEV